MAVQFLLGRAGAGKTRACLDAIHSRLRLDPIDGPRLILLVPEQASLQMEQALIAPADIGVAHRAEVLSFRRLAKRIIEEQTVPRRAVSDTARAMIVHHLLRRHRRALRYYRFSNRLAGLSGRLGSTIGELIHEGIRPQELSSAAEDMETDGDRGHLPDHRPHPSSSQSAKLHDLALLHAAYEAFLGDTRLDASQELAIAAELIPRCSWLSGAELWVDGFAAMSGQERRVLTRLVAQCREATISLLLDPETIDDDDDGACLSDTNADDLFRLTRRSFRQWRRMFRDAGIPVRPSIILRGPAPRFATRKLADLEESIFAFQSRTARSGAGIATASGDTRKTTGTGRADHAEVGTSSFLPAPLRWDDGGLHVVTLPNRRIEAQFAVAAIQSWVRAADGALRYRDIAVITRDLTPYADVLSAAMNACGIPCFLDHRRSLAHHPVIEWMRALAELAVQPYALEPMRIMLKTGLTPLTTFQADELENYLLEYGIEGTDAWSGSPWAHRPRGDRSNASESPFVQERRVRVNESRLKLIEKLDPWLRASRHAAPRTGRDWSALLLNILESWEIGQHLEAWTKLARQQGRLSEAQEHEQVWPRITQFLDDLSFAFADTVIAVEELGDLLETGLSGLTLGLTPPMVDQVLVSSIERSRHPDIKAAILIGFNDGQFPARGGEDMILNDADRMMLLDRGLGIAPPHRERILDERLLAYVALTRASHRMLVTCATADEQGRELRPSPFIAELLPYAVGGRIIHIDDPCRTRAMWDVQSASELAARLAAEFRLRPRRDEDDADVRRRWNTLYARVRTTDILDGRLRHVFSALRSPCPLELTRERTAHLYADPFGTSVTALESFARCPFQHFARHGLKLKERPVARMEPIDVGSLHHAILEDVLRECSKDGTDMPELTDEQIAERLLNSGHRLSMEWRKSWGQMAGRDEHLLDRAGRALRHVLRVQRAVLRAGRTRPRRAEVAFGTGTPDALPALSLTTPAGRTLLLRGYIDRVDWTTVARTTGSCDQPATPSACLGVVVDYKSSARIFDLREVYHGLALQLPVYMLVLLEHGIRLAQTPIEPVAGMFQTLRPTYVTVDHPSDAAKLNVETRGFKRLRGLVRFGRLDAIDTVEPGKPSQYLNVQVLKDGGIAHADRSDALEDADFESLLSFVRRKLGELADAILDGQVEVAPCRLGALNPCASCSYLPVCGYELGISRTRFLPRPSRTWVLEQMKTVAPDGPS